ncbi:helix-turn-helix domain-containing protein [Actinoplanes awajinensis]|uniref:helix-turn-helix domain-containing protein n=1 Tax=Actinoplanes awajinensis TaxID=135946 RepID=UPI0018DE39F9|nr:helix-turn-helix transcriptional regulator [Actinoplanes awajinensis]
MEILERLSTLARGATGHAAAAAALELAADLVPVGRRRLLSLAAADAQLAGEHYRAAGLLRRAGATGEPRPAPPVRAAVVAARREMGRGRSRVAGQMLTAAAAELWETGAIRRLPTVLALRGWALARAGDLTAAADDAGQALELAALTGDRRAVVHARHTRTLLAVLRGEPAVLGRAPAMVVPLRCDPVGGGLMLLAALAARGPNDLPATAGVAAEFLPDLLECRLVRDRGLSAADLGALRGLTRSAAGPIAASAWRVLGLTTRDGASDCFARAVRLHTTMDLPFDEARVHLSYGERLRRDGDRRAARHQLRTARDAFAGLGATPWRQRAERELTGTDETRTGRAPTGLTPAEYEVARIVATGVSTRETAARLFLSPKTVEFHLGKVFRKLGVSSRAQLAHVFPELAGKAA